MARIGIFGGSFNPVHNGHLAAAGAARASLALDRVVFVPSGLPPLKGNAGLAPGEHRLAMLRLALADEAGFECSAIEVERAGASYTVDTVAALRETWPAGSELFFLLGADCLSRLPRWKGIEQLREWVRFAVIDRGDLALDHADPQLLRIHLTGAPQSSTAVRAAVASDLPIAGDVPAPVVEYIRRNSLYRLAETRNA